MNNLQPRCAVAHTEQRRRAIARRVAGFSAPPRLSIPQASNLLSELPSAPDAWQELGGLSGLIVADLARRTGREIP